MQKYVEINRNLKKSAKKTQGISRICKNQHTAANIYKHISENFRNLQKFGNTDRNIQTCTEFLQNSIDICRNLKKSAEICRNIQTFKHMCKQLQKAAEL